MINEEGLRDWFGKSKSKDGKKGWVNVVTGGTCASDEPGEGTPKCVSSAKRASMSKAERLSAQRRKKKADPGQQQKSGAAKPTYVSTDPKKKMKKEEMELLEYSGLVRAGIKVAGKRGGRAVQGGLKSGKTATKNAIQKKEAGRGEKVGKVIGGVVGGIAGGAAGAGVASIGTGIAGGEVGERIGGAIGRKFDKKKKEEVTDAKDKKGKGSGTKDACYHKVKSRYSVWPSAYASGALVKCRKVGAANWGNKSESYDFSNWREDFKALEIETVNLIEPEPIQGGVVEEGKALGTANKKGSDTNPKGTDLRSSSGRGMTFTKAAGLGKKKTFKNNPDGDDMVKSMYDKHVQDEKRGESKEDRLKRVRQNKARKSSNIMKIVKKEEFDLDEGQKCWKGYEKKGTKKMFGKTYNNCVKKEEVEKIDEIHSQAHTPHEVPSGSSSKDLKKLSAKATKRIDADVDGDVDTKDPKASEMGEFIPSPDGKKKLKPKVRFEEISDWRSQLDEDWQKVNKGDKTDGMSQKAVNAYRRENPGSKLKTAVTGDPKPGSKDAKRRKSFCSRSKGQQDMHNIDCSKTPDKAICKARRRWKC